MIKKRVGVTRTNISIPADLKRRMDKVSEGVNWSALACRAFEDKVAEMETRNLSKNTNSNRFVMVSLCMEWYC